MTREHVIELTSSSSSLNAALFLSEDAPFEFPGFSMLCIGFLMVSHLLLEK